MKSTSPFSSRVRRVHPVGLASFGLALLAAGLEAQTIPPPPPQKISETIELSPFTVQATSDTSYGALNSNSITSFNAELEKLPISADVLTSAFMEDTNSTMLENM